MKRLFKKVTALVLGLLTIAGLAGLNSNSVEPVVKAEAATIKENTVLYLKPNSNWITDGARFAVYFFGNGDNWVSMEECKHDQGYYKVTSPSDKTYEKLIFCRMNPSTSENNWDNKWDQTGDLTWNGTDNLFTISSESWDAGSWSTFAETPTCNRKNTGSKSLYLEPNTNWKAANARFATYFYTCYGEKTAWVDMTLVPGTDDVYTVVIPEGTWHAFIFCRMNPSSTTNGWTENTQFWNQTDNLTYDGTNNYYKVNTGTWSNGGGEWSFYLTPNCKTLMEKLETTNTCANPGVDETTISDDAAIALYIEEVRGLRELFDGLCADEQKYIKDTKLDDNTTYYQRLTFLVTKAATFETVTASGANLLSNITSSNNILVVLIVGLLGLTAVGAYYFLNKKKYAK